MRETVRMRVLGTTAHAAGCRDDGTPEALAPALPALEDAAPIRSAEFGREMSTKTPNPIDIHVGSRLRMQRVALGLSQQ
jgi:hypothetical protein